MNLRLTFSLALLLATCTACWRTPTRIDPPDIDPSAVAAKAIELYDTDGDGSISSVEAASAPSLQYAKANSKLDTDADGSLSPDEIEARVVAWQDSRAGLVGITCVVKLDGTNLAGAKVTYRPAEFLPNTIKPAFGTTDEFGEARMSLREKDRPHPNAPRGVQLGFYDVVISKRVDGKETIAAEYNRATTLGQEISFQDPGVQSRIEYLLTSQ